MSKPIVRIHNIETDEIIDREMNDQEYSEWQKQQIENAKLEQQIEQAQLKKAAAEAKLAALGLMADDLKALGLG